MKTTMISHFTSTRMAIIKKEANTGGEVRQSGLTAGGNEEWCS
jgi:hypothetical protein